jgi:hypothetical protein
MLKTTKRVHTDSLGCSHREPDTECVELTSVMEISALSI